MNGGSASMSTFMEPRAVGIPNTSISSWQLAGSRLAAGGPGIGTAADETVLVPMVQISPGTDHRNARRP